MLNFEYPFYLISFVLRKKFSESLQTIFQRNSSVSISQAGAGRLEPILLSHLHNCYYSLCPNHLCTDPHYQV